MPWKTMMLRGSKVFARCDDGGELVVDKGRVEIRYRAGDSKAYGASPRNLKPSGDSTIYEDGHCSPASLAPPSKGKRKPAKKKGAKAAAGPKPPDKPEGEEVLVYCDGACSGNPGPAGLGVVMLFDDRWSELSEFLGRGTNNIAELTAILRAVEKAPEARALRIFTDSTYSIGVLQKGWKAKKNKELIAEIKTAIRGHGQVALHYVKGHAGVPLNERADTLAVEAVEARATRGWVDARRG